MSTQNREITYAKWVGEINPYYRAIIKSGKRAVSVTLNGQYIVTNYTDDDIQRCIDNTSYWQQITMQEFKRIKRKLKKKWKRCHNQ